MQNFELESIVAFDTETSGLNPYLGDLPFGFAFANRSSELYLDDRRDSKEEIFKLSKELFENHAATVLIHNAKFDMHHLLQWCIHNNFQPISFNAKIICTATLARIANNDRIDTKLSSIAKEYGYAKGEEVERWIVKNKAYKLVNGEQEKDFTKVPYDIISKYAKQDARVTYDIYFKLLKDVMELQKYLDTLQDGRSIFNILDREEQLTKTLFEVERTGVLINTDFSRRAYEMERQRADSALGRYREVTGRDFVDSGKAIAAALIDSGYDESAIPRTETGRYSLTNEILSSITNPIADIVNEHRNAAKSADTFYRSFLDLRDGDGRIHANFRQDATRTFRLSCSNPNLQNIPSEEVSGFHARKCFMPPEGYTWVSIDYKAQEMRLLFDMCGEAAVAKRIIAGEDVHEVTASMMNVSRKYAKTIGFGLVYGMGVQKMADDLGISFNDAQDLKKLFFSRMPNAEKFLKALIKKAEGGFIANRYGRVYRFNPDFAYKAPNYLIQGTGGEIGKDAMVALFTKYQQKEVQLISAVHDELNFYVHNDHLYEIEDISKIMVGVYKHNILPMDVDVSMSAKSWGECE